MPGLIIIAWNQPNLTGQLKKSTATVAAASFMKSVSTFVSL